MHCQKLLKKVIIPKTIDKGILNHSI